MCRFTLSLLFTCCVNQLNKKITCNRSTVNLFKRGMKTNDQKIIRKKHIKQKKACKNNVATRNIRGIPQFTLT